MTRGNSDGGRHHARHSRPSGDDGERRPRAAAAIAWLAAAVLPVVRLVVASLRGGLAQVRTWRTPRLAAAGAVVAATVLVPVSITTGGLGSAVSASATSPTKTGTSIFRQATLHAAAAGASTNTGPLSLSETVTTGTDTLCGSPTSSGSLIGEGSEVCYQITINDSGTTGATGATLNLKFVDSSGNASTEEQFRTQSLKVSGTPTQVAAPSSVAGWSNAFAITATDTGTGNTATETTGTATPTPTGTGLNSLALSLGSEDAKGPYTVDVAGVINDVSTTPAPVFLSASLGYTYTPSGGTATAGSSTCDQSGTSPCAAPVTPAVPSLNVQKSITTTLPSNTGQSGDQISYSVTITNPSKVSGYGLGFCDSLANSNKLSSGTSATYTYTPSGGPAQPTKTASSIPACPSPGPGGVLDNLPGGTINLAPGDTEVITYTLTLPTTPPSPCTTGAGVNFCNTGTGEWQSTASTVSTDVTSGAPTPVADYTSGSASLNEVSGPTLSDSVAATVATGDPSFDATTNYAVVPGETLTYTLTVSVPPTGLKSFTVQDTLPSGLDATTVNGTGVVGSLPSGNSTNQSAALSTAATSPSTSGSVVTFTFPIIENSGSSAANFSFAFTVKAGTTAAASAADQAQMAWTSPVGASHPMGSASGNAQAIQVVLMPTMTVTRLTGTTASGFDNSCTTDSGVQIPEGTEVCYQIVINPNSETIGSNTSPASLALNFQSSDTTIREQFDTQTVNTTQSVPAPFSQTGTSNDGTVSADGKKVTGNAPAAVSSGALTLNLGTISAGTPATIDVAGVLSGAPITPANLASVNINAALTSSYTFPGGTSTTAFNPTGQDTPAVTPIAPTVTVSKLITNDPSASATQPPGANQGDEVNYRVTITNTSPATDPATAYDLGFCDTLASTTGLSATTVATYTYNPKGGPSQASTAGSIPACPGLSPGGTLNNVAGGPINLGPGDTEVITYTLTMPSPQPPCPGQTLANFCNSGVAEWQIPVTLPSTTTTDPAGDTLTPYTSGTASLIIQNQPTITAGADVTGPSVPIGQQINYHYNIAVPPGGLRSVVATVSLPEGIGVATSSDTPPKLLGGSVDPTSASSYKSSSLITGAVANATVGSTDSADTSAVDNQITFNLGNLANNSSSAENLQIDFPAWVLNISTNAGSPPATSATLLGQTSGSTDTVSVTYQTTQSHTVTPAAILPTYTVIEPDVAVAQTVAPQGNTALPPVVDVNDHLVITDTVTNNGGAAGYNLVVDTAIPAGFSDATLTSPASGVSTQNSPPAGQFGFVIPSLASGTSKTVTWTIMADAPTKLGTGSTGVLGAPASTWQSLSAAPSPPAGNTDTAIAYRTSTANGSTADVGLTSPKVTTPGASTSAMQIGQRFTYSVSFVVPETGAKNVVLTSTLAPGLAYALGSSNDVTCTSGTTVSDTGCITVQAIGGGQSLSNAAAVDAETLPQLTGGNLVISLGDLLYPAPTSALVSSPSPTAEVTVSYDVYVTAVGANASPANVSISNPDTVDATYTTIPGGVASTSPLEGVAAPITVDNPALTTPAVSVSPAHAEVGVVNPGPALVQVTADVAAPTQYTAYGATLTVTLPAGLMAVNGLGETGVTGALAAPGCTGGGGSCVTGKAASGSTVTAFANKGGAAPTTCTPSDPAVAGQTVVAYLPVLASGDTQMQLTFDACVVPGTTIGTGSAQTLNSSVAWYSQPPPPPAAPPAGTGSLAAYLYPLQSGTATVDYTGTSVSMALAATNDGVSKGFTIGDTVPYTVTVGLPEAADPSATPPATPTSPVTLPAYSACLFLPPGLTFATAPAATAGQIGTGIVSTTVVQPKAVFSSFADANCPTQLAAQPKGTTLVELDYPAGTQVDYNGVYSGDSFKQTVNVTVGPDPAAATAKVARGTTETAAASVGVVNRSQTEPAASNAFTVTEPELGFTSAVPSSAGQGTNGVLAAVAVTNDNTDGLAAPAYNDHVLVSAPAATTLSLTPGPTYEMSQTTEAALLAADTAAKGSLSTLLLDPTQLAKLTPVPAGAPDAWTGKATQSPSGTGSNTIDFTSADPAPGDVIVLTYTFNVGPLVLNQTNIQVTTSLVNATSQPGSTAGRTYSSTGTGPSLVAPSSGTLTVSGPTAGLSVAITGPGQTVAPGASPTYTVKVTNDGPNAVTAVNLQVSVSPALTNMVITPPANTSGNGNYFPTTGLWDVSIPSGSSATLDVTGAIPQTATGTLTIKATATTSPQTTGVAQVINQSAPGTASLTESLQVAVDASVQIAAQGKLYSGQTATYVTTVSNAGPSAAGNITLTITPPAGTGFVDSSGTGWNCGKAFPLTCTFAGPLSAGKSAQVTTDLVVDQPTGSTMTVQAQVATANDTNPSNDTATTSGTVLAALISSAASSGSQQATAATAQPQTVTSGGGSSSSAPALAFTGDNEAGQTGFALIVMAAGLLLLLASRWRRRPKEAPVPGTGGAGQETGTAERPGPSVTGLLTRLRGRLRGGGGRAHARRPGR